MRLLLGIAIGLVLAMVLCSLLDCPRSEARE
jgi:tetrahydromethanopterin S-methyltransferase subunit F